VSHKKEIKLVAVTSSNIKRFSKIFTARFTTKFAIVIKNPPPPKT